MARPPRSSAHRRSTLPPLRLNHCFASSPFLAAASPPLAAPAHLSAPAPRRLGRYFLPTTRDRMLEKVDRRVSMLTRIPISHAEYIQVLRYNHMEHYSAHHDYFDPAAYASNAQMLASVEHG